MRAVVVHGLAEAEAALLAAGPAGVVLLSAPGAAAWPGPATLLAVVAAAAARHPGVPHAAVLDCGAAPGLALLALRSGWRRIVLSPDCAAFEQVAGAAAALGAAVLPARPEALDLGRLDLQRPGGRALLARWLAG
ncbi:hypothetical protein [Roseomonas sp. BN140053]|uniref:hypothetical protein n=1 Tax=Roseomonas sp. BN140053 TaxID=3391898 RepID=UPI0039E9C3CD